MAKYEIVVEETVILKHSIIVECEKREDLEDIPDPDCGFCDISDYAYSDEMQKHAKVISVYEDDSYSDTQSFELTDIIPCKEGN